MVDDGGAPQLYMGYNPMNTTDISPINHSEMGLMFTNLANELGHHSVAIDLYMGISINGTSPEWWFAMEHPIKIDDLGVPLFQETSIHLYGYSIWILDLYWTCNGIYKLYTIVVLISISIGVSSKKNTEIFVNWKITIHLWNGRSTKSMGRLQSFSKKLSEGRFPMTFRQHVG